MFPLRQYIAERLADFLPSSCCKGVSTTFQKGPSSSRFYHHFSNHHEYHHRHHHYNQYHDAYQKDSDRDRCRDFQEAFRIIYGKHTATKLQNQRQGEPCCPLQKWARSRRRANRSQYRRHRNHARYADSYFFSQNARSAHRYAYQDYTRRQLQFCFGRRNDNKDNNTKFFDDNTRPIEELDFVDDLSSEYSSSKNEQFFHAARFFMTNPYPAITYANYQQANDLNNSHHRHHYYFSSTIFKYYDHYDNARYKTSPFTYNNANKGNNRNKNNGFSTNTTNIIFNNSKLSFAIDPPSIFKQKQQDSKRFYSTVSNAGSSTDESETVRTIDFVPHTKNLAQVQHFAQPAAVESQQSGEGQNSSVRVDDFEDSNALVDFRETEEQLKLFQKLEYEGKHNEMLATFQFLTNLGVVPDLQIYNLTLRSISLRYNTGETLEESLTNLLNIYSDMLNKSVKPDNITYDVVLSTLFNGALRATLTDNTNQGYEYFQVAKQLFEVCDHNSFKLDQSLYELYLISCSVFDAEISIDSSLLCNILGNESIVYHYFTIQRDAKNHEELSQLFSNYKQATLKANEHIAMTTKNELLFYQFKMYQLYISKLIHFQKFEESTLLLDQLLNELKTQESLFEENASSLISGYLEALSSYDIKQAHEIFVNFDSIPWIPEIEMSCLLKIIDNCLAKKDYDHLNKFWNYAVIREDFVDSQSIIREFHGNNNKRQDLLNIFFDNSSSTTGDFSVVDRVLDAALSSTSKLDPVRKIKETMLKDSVVLSTSTVHKVLQYLIQTDQSINFITNFIVNQGYKRTNDVNEYLSSIVDVIPQEVQFILTQSNFFKNCCESYKLTKDNFYGIYKNLITTWDCKDTAVVSKLKLYYSLIYREMDDLDNFYVEMPQELMDFKQAIKCKLQDFGYAI